MTAVINTVSTAHQQALAGHLAEFRAALEQQRLFRIEQLTELAAAAAAGLSGVVDDPQDEVTDALQAGARNALSEIEAAIARIGKGRYGVCGTCNQEIPVERLEILPMAELCMRCAHAREQRAR